MTQTLDITQRYELFGCPNASCEAVAAVSVNAVIHVRGTGHVLYCSRGHPMVLNGPSRAQLEADAAIAKRLRESIAAEGRMREEAERRLARVEEEKAQVKRELAEARRTVRKVATVGAHAVQSTRSAHARKRKGARR